MVELEGNGGEFDVFDVRSWLCLFRDLTPKTRVLDLSREFAEYLIADGVFVAEREEEGSVISSVSEEEECEEEEEEEIGEDGSEEGNGRRRGGHVAFPELEAEIDDIIKKLRGEVAPKVCTRSPFDAAWMNFHEETKCCTSADVILLLKSSDRVAEEVEARMEAGHPITLVLRKWANLNPRMEFRVFVKRRELVAICQRDIQVRYEYQVAEMDEIRLAVEKLFERRILDDFQAEDYVVDVYVDQNRRVWIIDFARFHPSTDSLLFAWEEFESPSFHADRDGLVDFRIVHRDSIVPARSMYFGIPYELQGEQGAEALADAAKRLILRQDSTN